MNELVQIIPLGLEKDRFTELLRKFPPHRVYFIRGKSSSPYIVNPKVQSTVKEIESELRNMLSLAEVPETIEIDELNFNETLEVLLKLMLLEKNRGNEVILNITGGTSVLKCAATIAACITNSKIFYLIAKEFNPEDEFIIAKGILGGPIEIPLFPILLLEDDEASILTFFNNNRSTNMKLEQIVKTIGLEKLGVQTLQSGIVKTSIILKKFREYGYIQSIPGVVRKKKVKIDLTEKGKLLANVLEIRNNAKENKN